MTQPEGSKLEMVLEQDLTWRTASEWKWRQLVVQETPMQTPSELDTY